MLKIKFIENTFHDIIESGETMSIMTQLEFALDFTHAEVEIAHYILNHGEDVLNLSIKELAKEHIHLLPQ